MGDGCIFNDPSLKNRPTRFESRPTQVQKYTDLLSEVGLRQLLNLVARPKQLPNVTWSITHGEGGPEFFSTWYSQAGQPYAPINTMPHVPTHTLHRVNMGI